MNKVLALLIFTFMLTSCQQNKDNLFISGDIDGLKKGKIYLQKIGDSSLVHMDSIEISGNSQFKFETYIDEPQLLFIELERNNGDNYAELINFFAEPGEIKLKTSLKNYGIDLEIESEFENQIKLEEFEKISKRFNDEKLGLIEANFEATKSQDEERLDSINNRFNSILKRKYLYTVNFALNNKDLEIAPYVILAEAFDANIKYLDTVYNTLEKPIKKSLYGKQLKELIEARKKNDKESIETEIIENNPDKN